ncbi:MAG: hypothetical protein WD470_12260 [Rhodospirillaceae bacterium]
MSEARFCLPAPVAVLLLCLSGCAGTKPINPLLAVSEDLERLPVEDFAAAIAVGKVEAETEVTELTSAVELSLRRNGLLASDTGQAKYLLDVAFLQISATDRRPEVIEAVVDMKYALRLRDRPTAILQEKIRISRDTANPTGQTLDDARAGSAALILLTGGAGIGLLANAESIAGTQHRSARQDAVKKAIEKMLDRFLVPSKKR